MPYVSIFLLPSVCCYYKASLSSTNTQHYLLSGSFSQVLQEACRGYSSASYLPIDNKLEPIQSKANKASFRYTYYRIEMLYVILFFLRCRFFSVVRTDWIEEEKKNIRNWIYWIDLEVHL